MMPETFKTRRIVYLICLGLDIYMLASIAAQLSMATASTFLISVTEAVNDSLASLDGLIMLAAVSLGLVLMILFACEQQEKGYLFEGTTVKKAFFEKNESCGITNIISFAAILLVLQLISMIVLSVVELILNLSGYTISQSPAMNADYTQSFSLMLYAMLAGPIIEELVFRGFLLKALKPCGRSFAIFVSALMFSLMHADVQQIFFTFCAGLLFAYLAMRYSIKISIVLHIINNALFSELLMYMQEVLSDELFVIIMILLFVVSIIITAFYLLRHKYEISEYLREFGTSAGAYKALFNRWFIAFAAFSVAETFMTVSVI